MLQFLKPTTFVKYADRLLLPVSLLCAGLFASGLYYALFASPEDYQQGETVRIMYIHVPSAWMSLAVYSIIATASLSYIIWRNPLSELIARASAPIGACFALITLLTGSIWGKPIWGTWWEWDARLTSMLILFFLYIGYIALSNAYDTKERGAKAASILALVGFINVPIIKFSVDWWNTLHQPASVIKMSGPAIDPSMMLPLSLMFFAMLTLYLIVATLEIKTMLLKQKITRAKIRKRR